MVTLTPAVDWSHRGGAAILFDVGVPVVPVPVPPVVPDPPDPTPRAEPRRYTLVAHDGLSFAPIVAFPTVDVASYVAGQLGTDAMRHRVTVASTDPAWTLLCAHRGVPAGAIHQVVEGIDWRLYEDGVLVASGVSDGPVTSGATIDLRISGGGGILRDRFLGSGGISDLLDGRGKFPAASLAGWTIGDGVSWRWNTIDPFTGSRSLQVRGFGHVYGPASRMRSRAGSGRAMTWGGLVVRLGNADAAVAVGMQIWDSASGQLVPEGSLYEAGLRSADSAQSGWQQLDPHIRSPLGDGLWGVRVKIAVVSPDDWIDIGQVTHFLNTATGARSSAPVALEGLVGRVISKAQAVASGGPLGIRVQRHTDTGAVAGILWEDSRDPAVSDALSSILGRDDSPDAWFTPDRVLHLDRRAGRKRTDLVLNRDTVIAASIEADSGTRFDELRAYTGFGAGPSRSVVAHDGPGVQGAPRRRALVQAPNELDHRAAEAWIAGQGAFVARQQVSVRAVVPAWYGAGFAVGDTVHVALDVDGWRIDDRLRVGRITVQPAADTAELELGYSEVDQ